MMFVVAYHDDVMKWKCFPHHWPFVQGICITGSSHKKVSDAELWCLFVVYIHLFIYFFVELCWVMLIFFSNFRSGDVCMYVSINCVIIGSDNFVVCSGLSHYLNKGWLATNWTLQWNLYSNKKSYKMHMKMSSAEWWPFFQPSIVKVPTARTAMLWWWNCHRKNNNNWWHLGPVY